MTSEESLQARLEAFLRDQTGETTAVSRLTPVPGGVGPMTVASLLQNTLDSAKRRDGA